MARAIAPTAPPAAALWRPAPGRRSGSRGARRGGCSSGSARGRTADIAIVPDGGSSPRCRRRPGARAHLRGGRRRVLGGVGVGRARGRARGAAPAPDLLQPEEHHGDVVAAARLVGGVDQRAPRLLERAGAGEDRRQPRLGDHRGEAVRADEEDVAGAGLEGLEVDLDVGLGAERAGDHGALRVRLGLLLGELAALDQLVDERVVAGEPHELAVAQQVGARVADVGDRDLAVADVARR